jgi:serine protease
MFKAVVATLVLAIATAQVIPGEWIVVLKNEVSVSSRFTHMNKVLALVNETNLMHEYTIGSDFKGYAIKADDVAVKQIMNMAEVDYVEPNGIARIAQECTHLDGLDHVSSWGLTRTHECCLPAFDDYTFEHRSNAGHGVNVYVIDTGVRPTHTAFSNRVQFGYSFDGSRADGNGHGTHVAGTIAGGRHGLARFADIWHVRVLGDGGSGSWDGVIAGINWVTNHNQPGKKKVANMSLGGGLNQAVNQATTASVNAGVFHAVAAGNNNGNACQTSPASAAGATCVGATDSDDFRASYSNFGTCVHIFAPGSQITSAWSGRPGTPSDNDNAVNTISGTSMASPHVAGVAAQLWTAFPTLSQTELRARILAIANQDKLDRINPGSPNRLLYSTCDLTGPCTEHCA